MFSSNKKFTIISTRSKVFFILAMGFTASAIVGIYENAAYQKELLQEVRMLSYAVDANQVRGLKDHSIPDDMAGVDVMRSRLGELKNYLDGVAYIYLLSMSGTTVEFLADSELSESEDASQRFDSYPEATSKLVRFFDDRGVFIEGPVTDSYGTWYSAIAPVIDTQGNFVAAIGMDVPAVHYIGSIAAISVMPMIFGSVVAAAVYFYDKSRKREIEAMRFQVGLLSIASHELRAPLTGIRWGEEVLLKNNPTVEQRSLIESMHDATRRLQESIEGVLQYASLDVGTMQHVDSTPIDLVQLIDDTAKMQSLTAGQRSISFDYDASWAPMYVEGDSMKLKRVFSNLISNAIKYAKAETNIEFSARSENGGHTVIIKNYGMGIPAKDLPHVFDGFYRAKNAVEASISGTGMGLFMSRTIIEQHGGRMWLESVENESTTAYVYLPEHLPREKVQA